MAWGDDVFWQTTQKKTVNSTKNTFCPIPYWDYLLDKKAFSFIFTRKTRRWRTKVPELCMFEIRVIFRITTPPGPCIFLQVPPILLIKRLRQCREHLLFCQFFAQLFFVPAVTPHQVNTAVHLPIRDQFIFSHTTPDYIFNYITRHLF
jgi:hypothetical protein